MQLVYQIDINMITEQVNYYTNCIKGTIKQLYMQYTLNQNDTSGPDIPQQSHPQNSLQEHNNNELQQSHQVKGHEVKQLNQNILVSRNRIKNLKQQLNKEKQQILKNKQMTKQVLSKKVAVNSINSYKQKDNSEQIAKIQYLRKRNHSMKLQHQRSLQNIQKAIYLVKLDDAREIKNIASEHKRKMREMQSQLLNSRAKRKQQRKKQAEKAKQRYMKYWKSKLQMIYAQQNISAQEIIKSKQEKTNQLKQLEVQQMKLLEEINKMHEKQVESKKEYVAALSLPVKQVAEAVKNTSMLNSSGHNDDHSLQKKSRVKSLDVAENSYSKYESMPSLKPKNKKIYPFQSQSYQNFGPSVKVPNANINQAKLKIILQELKKIDKKKGQGKGRYMSGEIIRQENRQEEQYQKQTYQDESQTP